MLDQIMVSPKLYLPIVFAVGSILIYLVLSKLVNIILRFNSKANIHKSKLQLRRENTIINLIRSVLKYVITFLTILSILNVYGLDTKGIVASIGIAGAIIGLAFQDVIKNFLSGIQIVFDNHYMQGDVVTINGFKGEVISLGLQATKIKSYNGEVMIINNSKIDKVINHSMYDNILTITIPVDKNISVDKFEKIINECIDEIKTISGVKGDITVKGIDSIDINKYTYLVSIPCSNRKEQTIKSEFMKTVNKKIN